MTSHDKGLQIFREPTLIDDRDRTFIPNLSGRNRKGHTRSGCRDSLNGLRTKILFFHILAASVTSYDLISATDG